MQKKFEGQGAETVKITPEEFGKLIKTETVKWGEVVKEAGIKAEWRRGDTKNLRGFQTPFCVFARARVRQYSQEP